MGQRVSEDIEALANAHPDAEEEPSTPEPELSIEPSEPLNLLPEVEPDVEAAPAEGSVESQLTAAQAQIGRQSEEIGMMRQFLSSTQQPPQQPVPQPPGVEQQVQSIFSQLDADELMTDPRAFLNRLGHQVQTYVSTEVQRGVSQAVGAAQNQTDTREAFFRAHPDLTTVPFLVTEAAKQVAGSYPNLPADQAMRLVAEGARKLMLTVAQAAQPGLQPNPLPAPGPTPSGVNSLAPPTPPRMSENAQEFAKTMDFADRR